MLRWYQSLFWTAGICAVWCPIFFGLHGDGVIWICSSTLGLLAITVLSGYFTWAIIHYILGAEIHKKISRVSSGKLNSNQGTSQSVLEDEISLTAQTFYRHLIVPWYSHVSPDEKYALQIRSILEDFLMGISKNIQRSEDFSIAFQACINIYIQHYRNYYRTLRKVSQKLNKPLFDCVYEKEELSLCYKPLHRALKCCDTTENHCKKLSHTLLVNYLPIEMTRCSLLFIALRDLFAHKVLQNIINSFCDIDWLNKALISSIVNQTTFHEMNSVNPLPSHDEEIVPERLEISKEKCCDRISNLLAIPEESYLEGTENWSHSEEVAAQSEARLIAQNSLDASIGVHSTLVNYINSAGADVDESLKTVSLALGGFLSTTAVPLLPESSLSFAPLRLPQKMWQSPMDEKDFLSDVVVRPKNPFKKSIVEGITEDDYNKICMTFGGRASPLQEKRRFHIKLKKQNSVKKFHENRLCVSLLTGEKRSKSLNNLTACNELPEELSSWRLCISSEDIAFLSPYHSEVENSDYRKEKKLMKMDSFDKNDGVDTYPSLATNLPLKEDCYTESVEGDISELLANDADQTVVIPAEKISNGNITGKEAIGSCWENPDLSPIYEESENLATAIAKLRCLLSERQSEASLGSQSSFGSLESEPRSAQSDPGRYCLEKSKFTFLHKDSSGSLASVKSFSSSDSHCQTVEEEILEAAELPLDGRVFTAISIPTTEIHNEPSGLQYTLYIVQYDAIYLCDVEGISVTENDPKMVLHTNLIKRRFREFLSLHSSFEEDPNLRVAMKGVKGPNKWLNLPFSKLDSTTVSSRKLFLEKYLQAVIQRPSLNISIPLKEFLSYGSNSSISYLKKPLEMNVLRIDKLFARTVSGVFQSIKTALPNFDSSELSLGSSGATSTHFPFSVPSAESWRASFEKAGNASPVEPARKDFEVRVDVTAYEQVCEMEGALLSTITSTSNTNSPVEDSTDTQDACVSFLPKSHNSHSCSAFLPTNPIQFLEPSSHSNEALPQPLTSVPDELVDVPRTISSDDSLDDGSAESEAEKNLRIFSAFVDVFVEVVSCTPHPLTRQSCTPHPLTRQSCTSFITQIGAISTANLIKDKLKSVLSSEGLPKWLQLMRSFLKGQQCEEPSPTDSPHECQSKDKLKTLLKDLIPKFVRITLGEDTLEESLTLVVESLQNPVINMDFALHFIDTLFVHVLLPM